MRIIFTIIMAIFLTTFLAGTWYITQPLVVGISLKMDTYTATEMPVQNTQTQAILRYVYNIGMAILIIFVWVWAVISAQQIDYRSDYM